MSGISRRRFLSDSFFATAIAAGIPSTAWVSSYPALAATGKRTSPNDRLGIMVVGCGSRGCDCHVRQFLKDPRTKIISISDPDPAQTARTADVIAEAQNGYRPKIVADMREGLDDPAIDIVTSATTNHWHALSGLWGMQAGKHVYIEKPICHNLHEGKALIAAAKKYGVCCAVGTQCQSLPNMIEAFGYVAAGGIGEVKFTRGMCYKRRKAIGPLGNYPVPEGVDYRLWCGPAGIQPLTRERFHYDWHWQRLYGNGDSGNQGPHQAEMARTFLGVDEFPESVLSYGGRVGYDVERNNPIYLDAGDTANTEVSIYNYRGGKSLVFETRGLESVKFTDIKIGAIAYGSDGYLVRADNDLCYAFDKNGTMYRQFGTTGCVVDYHFNNFIQSVLDGTPETIRCNARDGHLAAGLSFIGNVSYYLGEKNKVSAEGLKKVLADYPGDDDHLDTLHRTLEHLAANGVDVKRTPLALGPALKFDPDNEVFVGNAEASAMESRDYPSEFSVPAFDQV